MLDNIESIREGDVIVLFDESAKPLEKYGFLNDQDKEIVDKSNIIYQKLSKDMTYDSDRFDGGGHTMYIEYLKGNPRYFNEYEYIWVFENDVLYLGDINNFIKSHQEISADVLVPQMGGRGIPEFGEKWIWEDSLSSNLKELYEHKGVLAYFARYSAKYLEFIINNVEKSFEGFFEIITPIICKKYDFSIRTFDQNQLGNVGISGNSNTELIIKIIKNETEAIEEMKNKMHHPVKL